MNTRTRNRRLPKLNARRQTREQTIAVDAAEQREQFRPIADGMFGGMLEGLAEIHRKSPELLTVLAG